MTNGPATRVVVIGDVIASRDTVDREALHSRLLTTLGDVNQHWQTDLRITVGDEYQGTAPTLGAAIAITQALRLALLPDVDVRHGIGRGLTQVLDPTAGIEDGPGWWAAREAIESAKSLAARAATRSARTAYRAADPVEQIGAIDSALLARDELLGRLDERSLSVLRGLLNDRTQREIAEEAGISASAVSQRVRHDGIGVLVSMNEWLGAQT